MIPSRQDQSAVPKRRIFSSLRSKIVVGFALVFLTVLVLVDVVQTFGVPFTDLAGYFGDERDEVFHSLSLIADLEKDRFVSWLAERKRDARFISDTGLAASSMKQLRERVQEAQLPGTHADLEDLESYKTLNEYLQAVFGTWSAYHKIQALENKAWTIMASTDPTEVGARISDTRGLVEATSAPQGISIEVSKSSPLGKPDLIINSMIPNRFPQGDGDVAVGVLRLFIQMDQSVGPLFGRGRDAGYPTPPAQIRTSRCPAYGSYLGCLT